MFLCVDCQVHKVADGECCSSRANVLSLDFQCSRPVKGIVISDDLSTVDSQLTVQC